MSSKFISRLSQFLLISSFLFTARSLYAEDLQLKVTKLADGVYAIEHPGHRRDGLFSGNTTVIIGSRQVFVVDSAFLPSVTREDIAQIRQWTDKPVTFLLNTHFHNDHNFGNALYLQAFPAITIIAHKETKRSMDMFGPGSAGREERANARIQKMLDDDKGPDGQPLSADDRAFIKNALVDRLRWYDEIKKVNFQSATLIFDHDFSVDIGNREVQVKFLGKGNTAGDAVAYLPKEKIAIVGDLLGSPVPMANDGYPIEWIHTLDNLNQLDTDTIVTGHGPVLHDRARILLYHDLLETAVDQLNAKLIQSGPAMSRTLDEVKGSIDLSSFKQRFIGSNEELAPDWDQFTRGLIKTLFEEASLQ